MNCASLNKLKAIYSSFRAPIKYCFGYGSGVFSQGKQAKAHQIDLIFGVENAAQWHEINLSQNPQHYSFIKHLGPSALGYIQNKIGAKVYYNPYTTIEGMSVKYGVIELDSLTSDLANWETLYLAGRMHKPIQLVKQDPQIANAQSRNLNHAMSVALLMLPPKFTESELFMKLASISYMGDVRMKFAENPLKVKNIVTNQFHNFKQLYQPKYNDFQIDYTNNNSELLVQTLPKQQLINELPQKFHHTYNQVWTPKHVQTVIQSLVRWPSFTQSLKGLATAGAAKGFNYSIQKIKKRYRKT